MLTRLWSNKNSPLLLGIQNAMATLEDRLAVSYKMILLLYDMAMQGSCARWYLPLVFTQSSYKVMTL